MINKETLINKIKEVLNNELVVDFNSDLYFDLRLDSMQMVYLIVFFEEKYNLDVDLNKTEKLQTVYDLYTLLNQSKNKEERL